MMAPLAAINGENSPNQPESPVEMQESDILPTPPNENSMETSPATTKLQTKKLQVE